jgi:hypothetical protein
LGRALELRLGGAKAAVNKFNSALVFAGDDDRIRGAFRTRRSRRATAQELDGQAPDAHTAVEGTPEQKRKARHMQFSRALAWAEDRQLIGVEEINDVTYLRLTHPGPKEDDPD